ncbi:glycine-rich domain-containing protein 1-like protein [Tanacetum coccineum]
MKDDIFLEGAVERYKVFLHMIRRNVETKSKNFCVPTYDIDSMWHTHQLHPLSYFNDTVSLLGMVLGHDDTDSDRTKGQELDDGFSTTTKQWKEMFSSSSY